MRRILSVIRLMLPVAIMLLTTLDVWGVYKIYRLQGDVTVIHEGETHKAQRRETLLPTDRLLIPDGGKVEILDSDSRRIYTSTRSGKTTVKSLIADAKEDASSLTRKTNEKMLAAVVANASTQAGGFQASGLSIHETNGPSSGIVLPAGVSLLGYLMALSAGEAYDDTNDIVLMRRDYSESDDTFNFAVFNTLTRPLYVNIIDQCPDGDPRLYFEENPIAKPRSETLIPEYRYLLPIDQTGYIVIASDKDFTVDDVKRLLDSDYTPDADFFFSLLRI